MEARPNYWHLAFLLDEDLWFGLFLFCSHDVHLLAWKLALRGACLEKAQGTLLSG